MNRCLTPGCLQSNTVKFHFKRWSRKPYALFKVLGQEVIICALSFVVGVLMLPSEMHAQNDTILISQQKDLDEVVVSAQRTPVIYSKIARVVNVIDKEMIATLPVQSVNELLRYALDVDIRQRGSGDVQADVAIRGGSFDQTLVLLNGVNISDPQTGHHNLDLPLEISSIERIEVLEGPGARVFGPNAFSGAVNIITGASKKDFLKLNVIGGDFNYKNVALSSSITKNKLQSFVSASYKASDGYAPNTDFNIANAYYQSQLSFKKVDFEGQAGYTEKNFGANSFYTPKYPDQYEATRTIFTSLRATTKGDNFKLSPVIYWRRHFDRFELFRENPPAWYTNHNFHRTDVYGANVNSSYQWGFGKSAFGFDFRSENIRSNVLGEPTADSIAVPGYTGVYYDHKYRRDNLSVFLEHNWMNANFSVNAGVMANFNSDIQGVNFYPGIDAAWFFARNIRLYTSLNRSLRFPTFTDLFYVGPTNIGNPDLKPEEAITWEGGLKYDNAGFNASVAVFNRWGTNIIDWVKEKDEDKWMPLNYTDVSTFGVEINAQMNFRKKFGSDFFIKRAGVSYSFLNVTKDSDELISRYVLDYLKHKATLSADFELYRGLGLSAHLNYQDRNGSYLLYDQQKKDYVGEVEFDPFFLLDAKLYYPLHSFTFFVEANNILDVDYVDISNVNQAGRWVKAGVSINLGI